MSFAITIATRSLACIQWLSSNQLFGPYDLSRDAIGPTRSDQFKRNTLITAWDIGQ